MRKSLLVLSVTGLVTACGQSDHNVQTKQVAPEAKKKPAYCFFKDEELKGWTANRDKDGNIAVKGKAHVKDPRYKAVLGPPTVNGTSAELAPTITTNDTGYAAVEDWWDLSTTIPNSTSVTAVTIRCGEKAEAQLTVPPKR